MDIFNVFQSIDLSDTVLLSQAQLLLGAVSIVFTYYIFRKQLKITKDQILLTEWIFKFTEIKKHLDDMSDIIDGDYTIEEKNEAKKIFNDLKEHYSEILQKRYF